MKVEAPCRLGTRFVPENVPGWKMCTGKYFLTGMDFFKWESQMSPDMTLFGKHDPMNDKENHAHFYPKEAGVQIAFEIPDEMIVPGYPLRQLGLDTNAVGRLCGVTMEPEGGWSFRITYGRHYGEPLVKVRTDVLDKLFAPVLPLHAVHVNLNDFL